MTAGRLPDDGISERSDYIPESSTASQKNNPLLEAIVTPNVDLERGKGIASCLPILICYLSENCFSGNIYQFRGRFRSMHSFELFRLSQCWKIRNVMETSRGSGSERVRRSPHPSPRLLRKHQTVCILQGEQEDCRRGRIRTQTGIVPCERNAEL